MRLTRAIDRYLAYAQLERGFEPTSLRSYASTLSRLDDKYPDATVGDFDGPHGTAMLRDFLAAWAAKAASTRATKISHVHSFFEWLQTEDLIEHDPAAKIKRPPKRKPHIERPTESELALVLRAARCERNEPERPAVLAMLGVGMRRQAVLDSRWRDWNLTEGTVKLKLKGGDHVELPVDPDVVDGMRACYRALEPDPDDYIFPSQRVRLVGPSRNVREVRDAKQPASPQSLWNMLIRVCKRAGVRPLHPHLLRHGFATQLDRDDVDLRTIQYLMGHKRSETTESYLDQRRLEAARKKLAERGHKRRQGEQHDPDSAVEARERLEAGGGNRTRGQFPPAPRLGGDSTPEGDEPSNLTEGVSHDD